MPDADPAATTVDATDDPPVTTVSDETVTLLRRALTSSGLRVPDGTPCMLSTGTREVYGIGVLALRTETGPATDAELSRRLACVAELMSVGVPLVRPARQAPLRCGSLRVSAWERITNDGPMDLEALGAALRRLHAAPLWMVDGLSPVVDVHHTVQLLETHGSWLPADQVQLLHDVLAAGAMSATLPERCCHGNLDPTNVLWDERGPHLADLDSLGRGSVLVDLAPVSRHLAGDGTRPPAEVADDVARFESGYGSPLPDDATVSLVLSVRAAEHALALLADGQDPGVPLATLAAERPRWSA